MSEPILTDVEKGELLLRVTHEDVIRVYSGDPGCGCGCRGDYRESRVAKTRMLNKLRSEAPLGEISVVQGIGEDGLILAWDTESRYRWVYLKRELSPAVSV